MSKIEEVECWGPRIKWRNLTNENAVKLLERVNKEGAWRQVEDADIIWEAMAECIC